MEMQFRKMLILDNSSKPTFNYNNVMHAQQGNHVK